MTDHQPALNASTNWHPLRRSYIRLLLNISFGLVLPVSIWAIIVSPPNWEPFLSNTIIAVSIANLSSWYLLDRLRQYANSRQLSYVLPITFISFGSVFAVIGLARLPYSISLFLAVMAATLITSYIIAAKARHARRLQLVIPDGHAVKLLNYRHFQIAPPFDELSKLVDSKHFDGAIIADLHFDHPDEREHLFAMAALQGIPVYHYRQILEFQTGQVRINRLSENELGSLIPNLPYMAAKRAFDVLSTILLMPFLIIVMLFTAIAVRLTSPGPILFIQERMGFRGDVFKMVKFRTMTVRETPNDHHARLDDKITRDNDQRITTIGRFLRKTRLDELPQIWNILKGDMSWIGPRPEAIELSKWYENEIPFYSYRHIVRPGITGWAQVNQGHVTELGDAHTKLRFDFYYVKSISLWLDILIALKTIRVVTTGLGAR